MRRILHRTLLACVMLSACADVAVDRLVTIAVPPTVPSIGEGTFVVTLYRYDPLLADGPAHRVFRAAVPFTHQQGVQTERLVRVHGNGSGRDRFYLAVEGCDLGAVPAQTVLSDGLLVELPSHVTMRERATPYDCDLE